MAIIMVKCLTLSQRLNLCIFSSLPPEMLLKQQLKSNKSRFWLALNSAFFRSCPQGVLHYWELSLYTARSALAPLEFKDANLNCQSDLSTKITENLFTISDTADPGRTDLSLSRSPLLHTKHTELQALLYEHAWGSLHLPAVIFPFLNSP